MGALFSALGALWRNTFGLLVPDSCRFTPSCSHYAAEAVSRRGLLLGIPLAAWRVLRCNPLGKGGFDPVVRSHPPCRAVQRTAAADALEDASNRHARRP